MRSFNGLAFCSLLQLHPRVPRNLRARPPRALSAEVGVGLDLGTLWTA